MSRLCHWLGLQLPRASISSFVSHGPELRAHGCHGRLASTYVQRLQAVPAEGVLAVLTHHLRAALIPLDVHSALGAALDGRVTLFHLEGRAMGDTR